MRSGSRGINVAPLLLILASSAGYRTLAAAEAAGELFLRRRSGSDSGLQLQPGLTSAQAEAMALASRLGAEAFEELEADPVVRWGRGVSLKASLLAASASLTPSQQVSAEHGPKAHLKNKATEVALDRTVHNGTSKMVLGMVLIQDRHYNVFNPGKPAGWLEKTLAVNQKHCEKHGHHMVMRTQPALDVPVYQDPFCRSRLNKDTFEGCKRSFERVNSNWEKEAMMLDYLERPDVDYVLVMDVDAVLVQPSADTMRNMARELKKSGRDVLLLDEDWREAGKGLINGGVLFAKSTEKARTFFRDLVQAHMLGPKNPGPAPKCGSNEQLCLQAALKTDGNWPYRTDLVRNVTDLVLVGSGTRFNRGACVIPPFKCGRYPPAKGLTERSVRDPELEVLHFVGASKESAHKLLTHLL